jgi:hypothetical protein
MRYVKPISVGASSRRINRYIGKCCMIAHINRNMRSWAIHDPQISNIETIARMKMQHLYHKKKCHMILSNYKNDSLELNYFS